GIGADTMIGGAGNDTYFVDNAGDVVTESAGAGFDAVWASVTYTLAPNVEVLVLNGTDNIGGTGNDLGNIIIGNDGNNRIDGSTGADAMIGGGGNDTFVFHAGEAHGDSVSDFTSGADSLQFSGYGA